MDQGNKGLALIQTLAHPYTSVRGLYWNTLLYQFRREWQVMQERIGEALPLAAEHGVAIVLAVGPVMQGWSLAMQGQDSEGLTQICQGLAPYQASGQEFQRPHFLAMLAETYGRIGQLAEGMSAITEALTLVEPTGERYYEAELHRLKGELLFLGLTPDVTQAELCFQRALNISRRLEAKSWELRAATSLA